MTNPLQQLAALGQSVWLDYIHRDMFANGQLRRLIEQDALSGMTSNPAIFEKAIGHGHVYDEQIERLAREGKGANDIYEALSQCDVQTAADELRGVYERSQGADGYVSLEVNPHLARDSAGTIAEGRRLWRALQRPNAYIKVPATVEGLAAIRQLISEGINVNVTLLFGLARYHEVMDAYLSGLEQRLAVGAELGRISSVASFFVSRIDTLVDALLEGQTTRPALANRVRSAAEPSAATGAAAQAVRGQVAISCAKLAYDLHLRVFSEQRFRRLAAHGARVQRLLWASTSTKDPSYPDVKYVEALIGPDTVDTMPLETLEAYRDHGRPQLRLADGLAEARRLFEQLPNVGIDIDAVSRRLEEEGIDKFNQPFDTLLQHIAAKCPPGSQPAATAGAPARTAARPPSGPRN